MDGTQWYRKPMRIGAMQWDQGEHMWEVPEKLHSGGFNVEQVLHVMAEKDDQGAVVFDKEKNGEKLEKYIGLLKEQGIRSILYLNAHIIAKEVFAEKDEWAQRDRNGDPIKGYEKFVFACVNSPWRVWFMEAVRQVLDYGIDGIFLDGPVFAKDSCFCGSCRKLFTETYGHPPEEAGEKEIMEFRASSVTRFVKDVREVIKSKTQDVILYVNSQGLVPNVTGCDIDGVYPYVDFLGIEGGFMFYGNPNEIPLWYGSRNAKYMDGKAKGKPFVIFAAGNSCPWTRYMHTPEESRLLFASAVANGANVWYGIHGPFEMLDTPGGRAAYEFNRYLAGNEEYYTDTRRHSDIALLWSRNTLRVFSGAVPKSDFTEKQKTGGECPYGSHMEEFMGFYEMLTRNHQLFSIVDDKQVVDGELSGCQMLILPNVLCMDSEEALKIKEYVRNGGTVLATSGTSFYDCRGDSYAKPLLGDMVGIECVEQVLSYLTGCSYMKIDETETLQKDIGVALIPGCSISLKYKPAEGQQILTRQYIPMNGGYDLFPEESFPSISLRRYGKGTVIYIAGNFGQTYMKYYPDAFKKLTDNLIDSHIKRSVDVRGLFESVEIEERVQQEKRRRLLHFVNYTGCMQRPINRIIPCRNVEVAVKDERTVDRVYSLYDRKDIKFEQKDGTVRFALDEIREYELAVLQFK